MIFFRRRRIILVLLLFKFLIVLLLSGLLFSGHFDADVSHLSGSNFQVPMLLHYRPAVSGPPHPQVLISVDGKPALVIFSARFDSSLTSVVLVGYFNGRISTKPPVLSCRLIIQTFLGSNESKWKDANNIYEMQEGNSFPYLGVVYSFYVGKEYANTRRYHMEVKGSLPSSNASAMIEMPVQFADSKNLSSKAAACIAPLRHVPEGEPQARLIMRLVEFIEVNRLLGVDHFFFYNLTLTGNASKVLKHYESIGWASVTQWSLAAGVQIENEELRYGEMFAVNDCLYAVRDRYRLVAFLDIDEFLVPTNSKGEVISLDEAAKLRKLRDHGDYCALAFRSGVFPPLVGSESVANTETKVSARRSAAGQKMPASLEGCKVANLLRNRRIRAVPPFPERTKMLAVARQIEEMNTHFAFSTWHCRTRRLDPSSEGLLHHFRRRPAGETVEDKSMKLLHHDIETVVSAARERLKQMLNIDICA